MLQFNLVVPSRIRAVCSHTFRPRTPGEEGSGADGRSVLISHLIEGKNLSWDHMEKRCYFNVNYEKLAVKSVDLKLHSV